MKKYDYLIVGAGLYGCVCANILTSKGYSVLMIEKTNHIGGTCYTEDVGGIQVHKYGAHIFRTNSEKVFNYFSSFAKMNNFINSPIAICGNKAYNLPFNMNTFTRLWDINKPSEAFEIINKEIEEFGVRDPKNLKEKAINLAGKTIFELFIKEYTEKQWGKRCEELPSSIIKRIPLRYTYDNNYYDAKYQGIPIGGYTRIFEKMLTGVDVLCNTDFNKNKPHFMKQARSVIYTGPIDEYFDYVYGELEYRGLRFVEKRIGKPNYQGNAVFNYSDREIPFTRSIEHKFFDYVDTPFTIVSFEYPISWKKGEYPYYPINDKRNNELYEKYKKLAKNEHNVVFGGRLGLYQYFDMQDTIQAALDYCSTIRSK